MAKSKTSSAVKNRYIEKAYDRINLTVKKGDKELIKAHADTKNETTNEFIKRAIHEAMGREGAEKNIDVTKKTLPNMSDPEEKE